MDDRETMVEEQVSNEKIMEDIKDIEKKNCGGGVWQGMDGWGEDGLQLRLAPAATPPRS